MGYDEWTGYEAPPRRRHRMRRAMEGFLGLLGVAVFLVFFLVVNAGYAYRAQCLNANGHVHTSWSYDAFNAGIPYVGNSQAGCNVHTAGRLALAKVGIWPIHDDVALTGPAAGLTTAQANSIYARSVIGAMIQEATILRSERQKLTASVPKPLLTQRTTAYSHQLQTLRDKLVAAQSHANGAVDDSDLTQASTLLGRDMNVNLRAADGLLLFLTGSKAKGVSVMKSTNAAHLNIARQLVPLVRRIAVRYHIK